MSAQRAETEENAGNPGATVITVRVNRTLADALTAASMVTSLSAGQIVREALAEWLRSNMDPDTVSASIEEARQTQERQLAALRAVHAGIADDITSLSSTPGSPRKVGGTKATTQRKARAPHKV